VRRERPADRRAEDVADGGAGGNNGRIGSDLDLDDVTIAVFGNFDFLPRAIGRAGSFGDA
jgi:hypothetical protein